MSYELSGTIKVIQETQTFPSGFSKREFVVTTEDRYPQDIKLECIKEKIELLENCAVGDKVTVSFDLRGNEYNDRYYVNLQAWKIGRESAGAKPEEEVESGEIPLPAEDREPADDGDKIPF